VLRIRGSLVTINTTPSEEGFSMDAFSAGTLAGAGSFTCESCGFAVSLREREQVPPCPRCGSESFCRASIFGLHGTEPSDHIDVEQPEWLENARQALVEVGWYIAFDDDERLRVISLQEGWTRVGRSLSAHIRLDDPTVSRRHALVHCEPGGARIVDDRSLNGLFLNGERVDWHELADNDEIVVGRFRLYFLDLVGNTGQREGVREFGLGALAADA
jgi:predicted RNA-binding Zn-ribbon protein involved in translation (DUF1610 family)